MRDERGFTLIELMVVILIIGVLMLLALPTFLGARQRASDRATLADIRTAFAAERAYYTDTLSYTSDPVEMTAIESAITYVDGDTPRGHSRGLPPPPPPPERPLRLGEERDRDVLVPRERSTAAAPQFASDPACGVADIADVRDRSE